MTALPAHTLICDCQKPNHQGPGKPQGCTNTKLVPSHSKAQARKEGSKFGWWTPGHGTGTDLCPTCRLGTCEQR